MIVNTTEAREVDIAIVHKHTGKEIATIKGVTFCSYADSPLPEVTFDVLMLRDGMEPLKKLLGLTQNGVE